jgi:GT2 family glycosyltransferase
MEASIVIVSHNRKTDLALTLSIISVYLDSNHEIRVFLDGCTDGSEELKEQFPLVQWHFSKKRMGASPARNALLKHAKGKYFIGFDDDSHPLQANFVNTVKELFETNPSLGVLSFQEVKGIFKNEQELETKREEGEIPDYNCNSFTGCGYAIRADVYNKTYGFPVWMDIYGEESCVSIEVMNKGFEIFYTSKISVHHRVNKMDRKSSGKNHFRFKKQLINNLGYYLVYFPWKNIPRKLIKLYSHNFFKYATKDRKYFVNFCKAFFKSFFYWIVFLKHRKPVSYKVISHSNSLPSPRYD